MEAVHQPAAPGEASDATTKVDEVDASALDAAHAQPAAPTTASDVEMTAVTPVKGAADGPAVQEKRMLEVDGPADVNGEAASSTSQPPKKKPRKSNGPKPVTQYCHQDHQPHDVSKVTLLRCTGEKPAGKPKPGSTDPLPTKPCTLSYCERCLQNRYSEDAHAVKASGAEATWKCPSCRGLCNCSSCRKKAGLDATGPLKELGSSLNGAAPDAFSSTPRARSAATAARSKLSAGFTSSGKVAAMSLSFDTPGGSSKKTKALKKVKASSKDAGGADDGLSDSSLSELTDSDEEAPKKKKPRASLKGKAKQSTSSPAPVGSASTDAGPKRAMPPRPPTKLSAPPSVHALSSIYAQSPFLPSDESLLARMHVREFFLRFLTLMPSLSPKASTSSNSSSSSRSSTKQPAAPSAQLARVLSALSDDILWLWKDRDSAAEAVQLRLLGALADLLLAEKAWTGHVHKLRREELDDVKSERHREVFDKPWRSARSVVERGPEKWWLEQGAEWVRASKEQREAVERKRRDEKKKAREKEADAGDESELSSLDSSDDDEPVASSSSVADGEHSGAGGDDDEEVDQLASDYEEPPPKLDKAGRRMKGERDMPAEERLAVICGLVELAVGTEAATKASDAELVSINNRRRAQRRELQEEKDRLTSSLPEKPPGNSVSLKVKEWQDECDKVEERVKQAETDSKKEGWHIQYDYYMSAACTRLRFASLGMDAHGTEYYVLAPPPSELFRNPSAALTSGFPFDRKPSDDGVRDYPLSWCVVAHGQKPIVLSIDDGRTKVKKEKDEDDKPKHDLLTDPPREWYVVRELEDLDALADWVDSLARYTEFSLKLGQFQVEHPKSKTGGVVRPPPSAAELERLERNFERLDVELPERLRQFADAMKWTSELAQQRAEGGGSALVERTRAHKA
ncbi:hypothetical protein Rhopal_003949-T1 [Rhodotorula paludigena]|uniref:Zinc-finger domain-containing protein n=1 Tax=Rhodotorula paludigena TaxID=86838 RepID=A0AAV5GEI2_9BASI|nr:hypothetical protein Rhopal_003949-T1 [Rhodotorula paludigena]